MLFFFSFFVHLLPEFPMPTFVSLNLFAVTGVPKVLQSISGAADVWRSAALTMRAMESPAWPALVWGEHTFDPFGPVFFIIVSQRDQLARQPVLVGVEIW